MSGRLSTYDPKLVNMWWGPIPLTEPAPGTFIRVARDRPVWRDRDGIDGEVVRIRQNSLLGGVTFRAFQISLANDLLSAALLADEATELGVLPFIMLDRSGRMLVFCSRSWIDRWPAVERGEEATEAIEWTFRAEKVRIFHGGMPDAADVTGDGPTLFGV